ncbi:anthranilate phosphoribosyltransferase [Deltaproteobacteria bacterium TL4]
MNELFARLLQAKDLSFEEARRLILWIMSEEASPVKAGALLALLQAKGVTVDEIAGAALAMRERSTKIQAPEGVIDTCSTGGNGISTFNISTCAAIIAAAAGAVVAKHGNRSNTRKSGSAEVIEALGVNIEIGVETIEACLQELNLCFCYAIKHHPAMKFAGPVRKELGIPTIFNILGPLTNPAGAKSQIIGVSSVDWTSKLAQGLQRLGSERVMVVHGADGLCELTTTSETYVAELRNGEIRCYTITPEEVGLKRGTLEEIQITTPQESSQIIQQILSGENRGTARDIAVFNSAGALVVAGIASSLKEGVEKSQDALDRGKAADKLKALIQFTQK